MIPTDSLWHFTTPKPNLPCSNALATNAQTDYHVPCLFNQILFSFTARNRNFLVGIFVFGSPTLFGWNN